MEQVAVGIGIGGNLPAPGLGGRCPQTWSPRGLEMQVPGGEIVDREVEENSIWVGRSSPNPVVEVEGEAKATPLEIDEPGAIRTRA